MSHDLLPMGEFFDSVAHQYDIVHTSNIDRGEEYYQAIAIPFEVSNSELQILDLGAGTGLDLVSLFERLPLAHVDCVDLSEKLMKQLLSRFPEKSDSISLRTENYLEVHYPQKWYDYILASATFHHFRDDEKECLFQKLARTIKDKGSLVIGDFYVSSEIAGMFQAHYESLLAKGVDVCNGKYHLDIPTTIENEKQLLVAAGFEEPKIHWQSENYTVLSTKLSLTNQKTGAL